MQESLEGNGQYTTSPAELLKALGKATGSRNLLLANLAGLVTFLTISGIRMTAIPLYSRKILGLSQVDIGLILAIAAFFGFTTGLNQPAQGRAVLQ
ncbi:MAG: hypothetical protein ACE5JO_13710, partial [Candidatus Binatia bacterium]